MAFEPLQTDELLENPQKSGPDFDAQMLFGCSSFVAAAFINYALAVWPHFVFQELFALRPLALACAFGMIPSLVFSGIVARRFGVAGSAGCLGGAFAMAIFMNLRLQQIDSARGVNQLPQPEFPSDWVWLIPVGWIIVTLITLGLSIRPEDFRPDQQK